ncbi:MAG: VWA domain-containing protein [Acidobacteria bacterium]|nr:VWA domain-containing protein [Acidobacteriota bacterium]
MAKAARGILRRFGIPLSLTMLLLFYCAYLFPQSRNDKNEAAQKSQDIIRVPINVVVVNATVTDRDGNFVTDLTSKDFRVYDDGKLQDIQTFALESYGPAEPEESKEPVTSPRREAMERNASRPRMISLVIDDLTMESVVNFPRMIDAMKDYVRKEMRPQDQVAVLSGSGKVQVPFSDNKQHLLDELEVIYRKLNLSPVSRSTCPKMTDLEAWRAADAMHEYQIDREKLINRTVDCMGLRDSMGGGENAYKRSAETYLRTAASLQRHVVEFQTHNLLYTLRQHIRTLKHFEGAKTVVLFSDGFLSESETPAAYQLQELIDMSLRSGIVLNSVSIRGLVIEGYEGGIFTATDDENRQSKEGPLSQAAYETGGMFSHSRNDLYLGIQEIVRRQVYYYILSYGIPARKADGSYHKIKLELTRPDLKLSYRKGYYVQKEELKYENTKKEDIIDALNAPGNMSEIPMTLSYNYSQEADATYAVSFITRANIQGLQFLEEDSRRKNMISLILAAFDESDKYISGLDKSIEFRLLEESYAGLRDQGLTSRVELKLPIGRYKIKAVVRESNQGKMGSVTKSVEIP